MKVRHIISCGSDKVIAKLANGLENKALASNEDHFIFIMNYGIKLMVSSRIATTTECNFEAEVSEDIMTNVVNNVLQLIGGVGVEA